MKKIFFYVVLAVMAIACEKKDEVLVKPELEIITDTQALVAPTEGGDVAVEFESNVAWAASFKTPVDWAVITPKSGDAGKKTINVRFNENSGNDNREVTVVLNAQGVLKELVVTQLQKDALVASPTTFDVPSVGQEIKVILAHNVDFKVTIDSDWVTQVDTKAYVEEELVFNVAANTVSEERQALITITAGDLTQVITVNQEAHIPTMSFEIDGGVLPSPDFWIDHKGGTVVMTVHSNFEYELSVAEGCEWLTVTRDGNNFSFEASPNAAYVYRSVEVIITGWTEVGVEGKQFFVFQSPREDSGESYLKYTTADYNWTLVHKFVRLASTKDYIIAANGGNVLKVFRKEDGSFVKDVTIDIEGIDINMLTNDDAGNIVFGTSVAYTTDPANVAKTNVYYMESLDSDPVSVGYITNQNVWTNQTSGSLEVAGNIKEDAILVLFTTTRYWLGFEVKNGAIVNNEWGSPKENFKAVFSTDVWNNYCAAIYPLGTTFNDGFLACGYSFNKGYYVAPDGSSKEIFNLDATTRYGNSNPAAIDVAEVDGKTYMAVGLGTFFNYSVPGVMVYDITDMDNVQQICEWTGIPEYDTTHWVGTAAGMVDVLIEPTGGKCYDLFYISGANETFARIVIEE